MYSPQESAQIQMWRQKALNNELTHEECKEALALLSRGRGAAATTSSAARGRSAAAKKPVDSNNLLDELGGL